MNTCGKRLGSVRVMLSAHVVRGTLDVTEGPIWWMHPVDWFAIEHRGDARAELDAVLGWHLERALSRLDGLRMRLA